MDEQGAGFAKLLWLRACVSCYMCKQQQLAIARQATGVALAFDPEFGAEVVTSSWTAWLQIMGFNKTSQKGEFEMLCLDLDLLGRSKALVLASDLAQ